MFSIDTPGVISRVSTLFNGHNNLIQGFNTFLPQGYRIECSSDPSDPNPIRVTTPRGTTSRPDGEPTIPYDSRWQQQAPEQYSGYMGGHNSIPPGESNGMAAGSNGLGSSMSQLHAAASGNRAVGPAESRRPGDPVEFNHAISYVNKIKTRFSSQPDIYKSFLEILQTYQREQLRIAEVYTQVTSLFRDAPDLLNDFKQFLPDMTQQRPIEPPNDNIRLPPVGSFAPPTPLGVPPQNHIPANSAPALVNSHGQAGLQQASRSKKKAQDNGAYAGQYDNNNIPVSDLRGGSRESKDALISPRLASATEALLPEKTTVLLEEVSFFEKAKKHIGNKQAYADFLKVLNLFSQKAISKGILVSRVERFIGDNNELINWFKTFVKYEVKPFRVDNSPFKKHMLRLSLCQKQGSYRLLPKSETYMPCSGRDEMCWEVLNDEWVSYGTWDSEETGYVAHRKNQYEDIMHSVEEERHEYDYYIEGNLRTIQTLETITSRIANMTPEEKHVFKLPPNLGHTSTIYEKVLKKIYGEGRYHEVVDSLRELPAVSVPIVLRRLKQKDEEWRRSHREWNKVWRHTEQKVFYKSLDHRGLTFKQTDKKYLTTRQLVSEITSIKAVQTNKRLNPLTPGPKEQLEYEIKDQAILMDILRLVMSFLDHSGSYAASDRERMEQFFKTFLTLFFSLPENMVSESIPVKKSESGKSKAKSTAKRSREPSPELLRDLLIKSKHAKLAKSQEESPSVDEEEPLLDIEKLGELWQKYVTASGVGDVFAETPRHSFNLFANTTVYVFFRLITALYERLEEVKKAEKEVSAEIDLKKDSSYAHELKLHDVTVEEMGLSFVKEDCYGQLLKLIEKLIEGNVEQQWYEEALRRAYRNRAYQLYTVNKVLQAIAKQLQTIVSDTKSSDILVLFENDRVKPTSSAKEQILYRVKASSVLGTDESMFRIEWDSEKRQSFIQFLGNHEPTLKQMKTNEDKWNYYLTSYLMSNPTEGVPADKVQLPFMRRNLPEELVQGDFIGQVEQGLTARVCSSTYRLFFEANSEDFFSRRVGSIAKDSTPVAKNQQQQKWNKFLEGPNGWKAELDEASLSEAQGKYDAWKKEGPDAMTAWQPPVKAAVSEDVEMTEAEPETAVKIDKEENVAPGTEVVAEPSANVKVEPTKDSTETLLEVEKAAEKAAESDKAENPAHHKVAETPTVNNTETAGVGIIESTNKDVEQSFSSTKPADS